MASIEQLTRGEDGLGPLDDGADHAPKPRAAAAAAGPSPRKAPKRPPAKLGQTGLPTAAPAAAPAVAAPPPPAAAAAVLARKPEWAYAIPFGELLVFRSTNLFVLFRSHCSASLVIGMTRYPGELLAPPARISAEAAPSPADVYWPNLLVPASSRARNALISAALTALLYLFWTVPVTAVQAVANLEGLCKALGCNGALQHLSPTLTAQLNTHLSSLLLYVFRAVTMYSGIFQLLMRLGGANTATEILQGTCGRMMLFQLIFVILISTIASSLWENVKAMAEAPTHIPLLLAASLPSQATFFIGYTMSQILFAALLDVLQVVGLASLVGATLVRAVRRVCPRALRCFGWKGADAAGQAAPSLLPPPPPRASEEARRRNLASVYAALLLNTGIYLIFSVLQPLTPFVSLLYFLVELPSAAAILRHGVYGGLPEVDTAGACWEVAIRYQTWSLLVAQLLLVGLLTTKNSKAGAALALVALLYTALRTHWLRERYAGLASALPLQRTVELDLKAGSRGASSSGTPLLGDDWRGASLETHAEIAAYLVSRRRLLSTAGTLLS